MNEKKKILIVDDDPDFLEQLRITTEAAGYEPISASSAEEARTIIADLRPDAAVIDLMMEHADAGITLAYNLKQLSPPVPVIMATAATAETGLELKPDNAEGSSWLKVDAVLSKPLRFEQIRCELEKLLGNTKE